jgi:hypothetical protein
MTPIEALIDDCGDLQLKQAAAKEFVDLRCGQYAGHLGTKLEHFTLTMAAGYRAGKMINPGVRGEISSLWSSKKVAQAALDDAKALLELLTKEQTHEASHSRSNRLPPEGVQSPPADDPQPQ